MMAQSKQKNLLAMLKEKNESYCAVEFTASFDGFK